MNLRASARIGDAERWKMAEFLGEMYAQGVLVKGEYEARRDEALRAVTASELMTLVQDVTSQWGTWNAREREKKGIATLAKAVQPPPAKTRQASMLTFFFALVLVLFGAAEVAVTRSGAPLIEGIGTVIVAGVIAIRETIAI